MMINKLLLAANTMFAWKLTPPPRPLTFPQIKYRSISTGDRSIVEGSLKDLWGLLNFQNKIFCRFIMLVSESEALINLEKFTDYQIKDKLSMDEENK